MRLQVIKIRRRLKFGRKQGRYCRISIVTIYIVIGRKNDNERERLRKRLILRKKIILLIFILYQLIIIFYV